MALFDAAQFARALKTAMAVANVSRQALAEFMDVNPATVSEWRGGSYLPDPDKRPAIARRLGVSEAELFGSATEAAGEELSREEHLWMLEFEVRLYREYGAKRDEVEAAKAYVMIAARKADAFMATAGDMQGRDLIGLRFAGSAVRRELERRRAVESEPLTPTRDRLMPATESGDAQTDTQRRGQQG